MSRLRQSGRLRPRAIARQLERGVTLPQRLARELRWALRDLRDFRNDLAGLFGGQAPPERQPPPASERRERDAA